MLRVLEDLAVRGLDLAACRVALAVRLDGDLEEGEAGVAKRGEVGEGGERGQLGASEGEEELDTHDEDPEIVCALHCGRG